MCLIGGVNTLRKMLQLVHHRHSFDSCGLILQERACFALSLNCALFLSSFLRVGVQVLAGYNASVFAYGQTASGKTHTIFGDHAASQGILAHAMNHIFAAASSSSNQGSASSPSPNQNSSDALTVSISVVQIYNEQISDLLWEPPPGTKRNGAVFCNCYILIVRFVFSSDCCL